MRAHDVYAPLQYRGCFANHDLNIKECQLWCRKTWVNHRCNNSTFARLLLLLLLLLPVRVFAIGWQDTVTGFLLAGVGHRTVNTTNFLVVKNGER